MPIYAITNHKGGVGKTTSSANLGAAFAQTGRRVLLLDLDPQASLTAAVGAVPAGFTMEDVLASPRLIEHAIVACAAGMQIVPARATLAIRLHQVLNGPSPSTRLSMALRVVQHRFDITLIDCPSALGAAITNALTAADVALVPVQCDFLSLRGLADIQSICSAIQEEQNPRLQLRAFASMYDRRTGHAMDVLTEARQALGPRMFATPVPRSVRLAEAPATGRTILEYAPRCSAAEAYRLLAHEILEETTNGATRRHSSSNAPTALQSDFGRSAGARSTPVSA